MISCTIPSMAARPEATNSSSDRWAVSRSLRARAATLAHRLIRRRATAWSTPSSCASTALSLSLSGLTTFAAHWASALPRGAIAPASTASANSRSTWQCSRCGPRPGQWPPLVTYGPNAHAVGAVEAASAPAALPARRGRRAACSSPGPGSSLPPTRSPTRRPSRVPAGPTRAVLSGRVGSTQVGGVLSLSEVHVGPDARMHASPPTWVGMRCHSQRVHAPLVPRVGADTPQGLHHDPAASRPVERRPAAAGACRPGWQLGCMPAGRSSPKNSVQSSPPLPRSNGPLRGLRLTDCAGSGARRPMPGDLRGCDGPDAARRRSSSPRPRGQIARWRATSAT